MFGVDTTEFIIVAIAALLFIGPKDLPAAMLAVGRCVGKIRGMARHFNAGVEAMMREAELEEMEKKWREENERIMREYPALEAEIAAQESDQPPLPLETPAQPPPEERELP
jgi:sec-independent protein translocase protein TatB